MSKKTQIVGGVGVVAVLLVGFFLYSSRPLAAPTTTVTSGDTAAKQGEQVFVIDNTKSTATYEIDETLNGQPVRVVGVANQVNGTIVLNTANPAASRVEGITINARTFKTDNERRDNTVGRMILKSEEPANELITFKLVEMFETPEAIKDGEKFPFSITGELTIAGVTKEVAFNGEATKTGKTLVGMTESVINYSDFGLVIPKLPFLAWVDDKVAISVQFTANAQ